MDAPTTDEPSTFTLLCNLLSSVTLDLYYNELSYSEWSSWGASMNLYSDFFYSTPPRQMSDPLIAPVQVVVVETLSPTQPSIRTTNTEAFLCLLVVSASLVSTAAICCVRPSRAATTQTEAPLTAIKLAPS